VNLILPWWRRSQERWWATEVDLTFATSFSRRASRAQQDHLVLVRVSPLTGSWPGGRGSSSQEVTEGPATGRGPVAVPFAPIPVRIASHRLWSIVLPRSRNAATRPVPGMPGRDAVDDIGSVLRPRSSFEHRHGGPTMTSTACGMRPYERPRGRPRREGNRRRSFEGPRGCSGGRAPSPSRSCLRWNPAPTRSGNRRRSAPGPGVDAWWQSTREGRRAVPADAVSALGPGTTSTNGSAENPRAPASLMVVFWTCSRKSRFPP
jgi:hypothetical protein